MIEARGRYHILASEVTLGQHFALGAIEPGEAGIPGGRASPGWLQTISRVNCIPLASLRSQIMSWYFSDTSLEVVLPSGVRACPAKGTETLPPERG